MDKKTLASRFFNHLSDNSSGFVDDMIRAEMDEDLLDFFNLLGSQLNKQDMDPERFKTSLLIIGYLIRAHEQISLEADKGADASSGPADEGAVFN